MPFRNEFISDLEEIELNVHQIVPMFEDERFFVYFPIGAMVSTFYTSKQATIELHSIGCEGVLGTPSLRATERIGDGEWLCQISGSLLRMPIVTYERYMQAHQSLAMVGAANTTKVLVNLTQAVACNGLHSLAQRCAKWLLLAADRVGSLQLRITHALVARSLGVRRAGITVALQALQHHGLIEYQPGSITILDSVRLVKESCECYARMSSRA